MGVEILGVVADELVDTEDVYDSSQWRLERAGKWTRVDFEDEQVVVTEDNYRVKALVGLAIFALVSISIAYSYSIEFAGSTVLFTLLMLWALLASLRGYERIRLLITKGRNPSDHQEKAGFSTYVIPVEDVAALILRENVHRDHVEDDRLVQVYLRQASSSKHHFVYQSYFATRHRALQICKELQLWIDEAQSSEA